MINVDCNFDLWKNKNKTITWFWESRFIVKNVFVILLFACFLLFVFWDLTKLELKLTEQENKA